jgi:hypothetical protein
MMPGDIRTWVEVAGAESVVGWKEKYSGKTFMLVQEYRNTFASTWSVLFEGRSAVYSEDLIKTHSMPLRGDNESR